MRRLLSGSEHKPWCENAPHHVNISSLHFASATEFEFAKTRKGGPEWFHPEVNLAFWSFSLPLLQGTLRSLLCVWMSKLFVFPPSWWRSKSDRIIHQSKSGLLELGCSEDQDLLEHVLAFNFLTFLNLADALSNQLVSNVPLTSNPSSRPYLKGYPLSLIDSKPLNILLPSFPAAPIPKSDPLSELSLLSALRIDCRTDWQISDSCTHCKSNDDRSVGGRGRSQRISSVKLIGSRIC